MQVLSRQEWQEQAAAHAARADRLLAAREHNPVEDFLWTYYATRPVHLRTWHPGAGVVLMDAAAEYSTRRGYLVVDGALQDGAVQVDPEFIAARSPMIEQVEQLLTATSARPAQHGCFGMHEWAMVYGLDADAIRHATWPLRFAPERTQEIVNEIGVQCSHFDAFRFFTEAARPLNPLQPTRATQVALEQPGCIHANMDLLKWSLKLLPMIPSSLLLDAFTTARRLRVLDMQASPYDLSALGLDPVRIETEEGRVEYARRQRELAEESMPIRAELASWCRSLLVRSPATAQ